MNNKVTIFNKVNIKSDNNYSEGTSRFAESADEISNNPDRFIPGQTPEQRKLIKGGGLKGGGKEISEMDKEQEEAQRRIEEEQAQQLLNEIRDLERQLEEREEEVQ